jgi:hypothetical protein
MILLVWLVPIYGVLAAIWAAPLSWLITYPLRAAFTRKYKAWDPLGELGLIGLAIAITALTIWLKWASVSQLLDLQLLDSIPS